MFAPTKKLEELLAEGKFSEARGIIADFFSRGFSSRDRASAQLLLAEIYLRMAHHINLERKEVLESAVALLEKVDRAARRTGDDLKLREARAILEK